MEAIRSDSLANAVSALLAIAGTVLARVRGAISGSYATMMEPAVAGVFPYIACIDLLPEIAEQAFIAPLIRDGNCVGQCKPFVLLD